MSYIDEKLSSIEHHAENLANQKDPTGLGIEQEFRWLGQAVASIRRTAKMLFEHNFILFQIKDLVEKGGDPAIIVKKIENALKPLKIE